MLETPIAARPTPATTMPPIFTPLMPPPSWGGGGVVVAIGGGLDGGGAVVVTGGGAVVLATGALSLSSFGMVTVIVPRCSATSPCHSNERRPGAVATTVCEPPSTGEASPTSAGPTTSPSR